MATPEELMKELPPELRAEARDFIEFLLRRQPRRRQSRLRLSWAGGLGEFRDRFTSLELQRKALDWWHE
jgi:hypothetical protein